MDHIFENEGKPVPDLAQVSSTSAPPPPANDDDEDMEALRAQYEGGAGDSAEGVPASGAVAQVGNFMHAGR